MKAHVHFKVDFDDDWSGGDIWLPLGVLEGYVDLRIGSRRVLDYSPHGMNASAVALLRTLNGDHVAATRETEDDARWPLFFCCGSLWNKCGIVSDFTVRRVGDQAVLSEFLRCKVPPTEVLQVPWHSWATAVERVGRDVLRRCPTDKQGVSSRFRKRYGALRAELRELLAGVRASNRTLQRPRSRVTPLAAQASRHAARRRA